jgi:hypothetical protein
MAALKSEKVVSITRLPRSGLVQRILPGPPSRRSLSCGRWSRTAARDDRISPESGVAQESLHVRLDIRSGVGDCFVLWCRVWGGP